MKKLLLVAAAFITTATVSAQEGRKSPHETVKGNDVSVTYGRPYKKGRVVFGELEKYGKVWRTGADEATTITFDKDSKFGGETIKAGTYTLFTIPDEKEWTIILNSELNQWGAYKYNKDKDVLKVKVPSRKLDKVVEQHTIRFDKKDVIIEWDQTQVAIPIES